MKTSLIIHSTWAIIAVIAFVVGSKKFSAEPSPDSSEAGDRPGGRYSERSQANASSGARNVRSATRSNRFASDTASRNSGKVNLTENGIKSLGRLIQTSNDPIERRIAFSKLLEGLTAENAMLMREQITHMSSNSSEWREFHYAWGGLAGEEAVMFGKDSKKLDMAACLGGWAGADPRAALAWYQSQSDESRKRNDLKWGVVYGLSNNDPMLATEFVFNRSANGDEDADKMINLVAASLLRAGSASDAARWSENLPEGKLRDTAVSRVARDFAVEDPAKAVAWLTSLPESQGQTKGMSAVFSSWANRDSEAAASRINQMADSPMRDSAVRGYSGRVVYRDPIAAINLANTISNPKSRDESLVRYGRIYLQRDREAATRWLANSNLTPELQKRINSSHKRR